MATFLDQPVSSECCEDPCADRTSPCDPCTDCDCPPSPSPSAGCRACPQGDFFGFFETMSFTGYFMTSWLSNWTWTSLAWDVSNSPICRFRGESNESSPCSLLLIWQFSETYGWWCSVTGTCIEGGAPQFFWGSPQYGCNDNLEGATFYHNGDPLADDYVTIDGE